MVDSKPAVKPNAVARALLAGFIASTVMMYIFGAAFWLSGQSLRFLGAGHEQFAGWIRNLTYNYLISTGHSMLPMAVIFHLVVGMGWAVTYGVFAEPRLHGPAWSRGVAFSLLPWLLSLLVFMPMVGAGVLGLNLGAGPLPAMGNLILHLCYGLILGVAYGPLGDAVMLPDATQSDRRFEQVAMFRSTRRAAQGLVLGIILGSLVGTSLFNTLIANPNATWSPAFVLMAGILLGGALGCLLGAFAGLPTAAKKREQE